MPSRGKTVYRHTAVDAWRQGRGRSATVAAAGRTSRGAWPWRTRTRSPATSGATGSVAVSAVTGEGIDDFLRALADRLRAPLLERLAEIAGTDPARLSGRLEKPAPEAPPPPVRRPARPGTDSPVRGAIALLLHQPELAGEVRAARSTLESEKLGLWLVERGRISEDDRALTLLSQGGSDAPPLGHLLVTRGCLDQETLEAELQELALAIIRRAAEGARTYCEFMEGRDAGQLDTGQLDAEVAQVAVQSRQVGLQVHLDLRVRQGIAQGGQLLHAIQGGRGDQDPPVAQAQALADGLGATEAAVRVAERKPTRRASSARSTRPPSMGNASNMLNAARPRLIVNSCAAKAPPNKTTQSASVAAMTTLTAGPASAMSVWL